MDELTMKAKIITQDALLRALCLTRRNPDQLTVKFNEIVPEIIRNLNKASPDNATLTAAIQKEWGLLSHYTG